MALTGDLCATTVRGASRAPSHWLSLGAYPRTPKVCRLPAHAEVVVIGGGVIGLSVAYWLARGGRPALVLESKQLAWGASGRNAGLMLAGVSELEDPSLLRQLLDEESIDPGYEESGHLALATSPGVLDQFHSEVARRPAWAPRIEVLSREECEDFVNRKINPRFVGGRLYFRGAVLDPVRLVYGLATAAASRGTIVVQDTRAAAVAPTPLGDCIVIRTNRGEVRARTVVIACNANSAALLPGLGKVLRPSRAQVLSTSPLRRIFSIGLAADYGSAYWRQARDGAIVLGGLRGVDPSEENNPRPRLNWRIQTALTRFLPDAFPGFPPFHVARRWAGIMDITSDGDPVIGRWPALGDAWVVAGFGGHGIPPSIGVGQAVARSIISDQREPSLLRFDPLRFKEVARC